MTNEELFCQLLDREENVRWMRREVLFDPEYEELQP